jgi:hypothetical protein
MIADDPKSGRERLSILSDLVNLKLQLSRADSLPLPFYLYPMGFGCTQILAVGKTTLFSDCIAPPNLIHLFLQMVNLSYLGSSA